MQCISPVYLNNNGKRLFVPCGKCNFCLERRRNDWSFRLLQEQKRSISAHFVTLTYADEYLPVTVRGDPTLEKRHLQLFFKRIRDLMVRKSTIIEKYEKKGSKWPKMTYYAVGEYGTKTLRPHYHMIVFNIPNDVLVKLELLWDNGFVDVKPCNQATIHYTTKYMINKEQETKGIKPFSLCSKGIGENYLQKNISYHKNGQKYYVVNDGVKMPIPKYYKDKIFGKYENQINAAKTEKKVYERYQAEVNRLAKYHSEPESYLVEKIRQRHENFKSKVNKKDKL